MKTPRQGPLLRRALGLAILVMVTGGAVQFRGFVEQRKRSEAIGLLARVPAVTTDLHVKVNAGGQVDSISKTLIECELESLSIFSEGRTLSARNASTIIELIPEGTNVQQDDVLCRLDSSEFEEMVRQQEIKVQQARADYQRSVYDRQSAEMSLKEYRDGLIVQRQQDLQGLITLNRSDAERQRDRLVWAKRMVNNRYISEGQLLREQLLLLRSNINLERVESQLKSLTRFEFPAAITRLEGNLKRATAEVTFQALRLRRREEQLAKFQKQVERCTIRAPHPGFVVYANDQDSDPRIELGSTVYQNMDLFYLPDMGNMEVKALVNETFVTRISEGMPALIRVEALPARSLEGHVTSVSPLPQPKSSWRDSDDIKNFVARIRLHDAPEGLRPGMSAQVDILTDHRPRALVIPTTAVTFDEGRASCYVADESGLQKRPIETLPADTDYLQVTSGLEEGEQVITNPVQIDPTLPIADLTILRGPGTLAYDGL